MVGVSIRDRIRQWLLGDVTERITRLNEDMLALSVDAPSLTMFRAMEQKQAERHKELLQALDFRNQARISIPVYTDFESSQALALEEFKEK